MRAYLWNDSTVCCCNRNAECRFALSSTHSYMYWLSTGRGEWMLSLPRSAI